MTSVKKEFSEMNRRAALAFCGGLGVAATAGCMGGSQGLKGQHGLQILGNPYIEKCFLKLIAAYVAAKSGRSAALRLSPRENDNTLRELLLANFTGAPLPDLAFVNANMVRVLADRQLAAPLDRTFVGRDVAVSQVDGLPFGLRLGLSVPVVVYNTALVERAGLSPSEFPDDWDGVLATARRIKDKVPDAMGGFIEHDDNGALTFLMLLASFGLAPLSTDERDFACLNARGVEALRVLRGFGEAGQADKDMSRRQARRTFQAGGIGVFVTMSSVLGSFAAGDNRVPFRVKPIPMANSQARVPAAGPVGVLMAHTRPDVREHAIDFLRFSVTTGQSVVAKTSGYLPANPQYAQNQPGLADYADPARIIDWYSFPGPNASKLANYIRDILQQIVTLQIDPAVALAQIATYAQSQVLQGPRTAM